MSFAKPEITEALYSKYHCVENFICLISKYTCLYVYMYMRERPGHWPQYRAIFLLHKVPQKDKSTMSGTAASSFQKRIERLVQASFCKYKALEVKLSKLQISCLQISLTSNFHMIFIYYYILHFNSRF